MLPPQPPIRLAAVRYLNTAPLITGLEDLQGLSLELMVPSRIAEAVASRRADIGLVSIIDLARAHPAQGPHPVRLAGLRAGMIGSNGRTMTVRIFSRVDPRRITHLHADTDSHTSVALASLILAHRTGSLPTLIPFDTRERIALLPHTQPGPQPHTQAQDEWPEALLLIGDKVVTQTPSAVRYPHQIDLGEAWRDLTGLPFVYALWACRAGDSDSPQIATAAALLDRQRRRNAMRIDAIATEHARRLGWPDDLARRYLGELLRYELSADAVEGAERFLDMAAQAGLAQPDTAQPGTAEPSPIAWAQTRSNT